LNYVAEQVLANLRATPKWGLHFLPDVLGKLAMLPGNTDGAVSALFACEGMVTEVMTALTKILATARMAAKTQVGSASKSRPEAQLLTALSSYGTDSRIVRRSHSMRLDDCDPVVLRAFVDECLRRHTALIEYPRTKNSSGRNAALADALKVWLFALKSSDDANAWRRILSDMESEVRKRGGLEELGMLLLTIAEHIPNMHLDLSKTETMVAVCREFFERVLAETPTPQTPEEKLNAPQMDAQRRKEFDFATNLRSKIIREPWVELVAQGCSEGEVKKLFSYVQPADKEAVVVNLVNRAVFLANKASKYNPADKTVPVKVSVGQLALWWLAAGTGDNFVGSLATMWPRLLVGSTAAATLEKVLEYFNRFPQNLACVSFVKAFAVDRDPKPKKESRRQAIKWLASNFPRDAVQMWSPALFQKETNADPGALVEDVNELLVICSHHDYEIPEFPTKISPEVIKTLSASEIPQARLVALRALQEMDLKKVDKPHSPMLNALRSDSSTIVAASARLAWRGFFGGKDVAALSSGGDSPTGELDRDPMSGTMIRESNKDNDAEDSDESVGRR